MASITALKFEANLQRENQSEGNGLPPQLKGIMNLSVETKVAIAVATSFILLVVGAMAQG